MRCANGQRCAACDPLVSFPDCVAAVLAPAPRRMSQLRTASLPWPLTLRVRRSVSCARGSSKLYRGWSPDGSEVAFGRPERQTSVLVVTNAWKPEATSTALRAVIALGLVADWGGRHQNSSVGPNLIGRNLLSQPRRLQFAQSLDGRHFLPTGPRSPDGSGSVFDVYQPWKAHEVPPSGGRSHQCRDGTHALRGSREPQAVHQIDTASGVTDGSGSPPATRLWSMNPDAAACGAAAGCGCRIGSVAARADVHR